MKERITTKELAKLCNVSLGTVDRALNNRYGISKKTREKVLNKAKELNYTPNRIGRSLQSGRTYDIGLVVHDLDNRYFSLLVNSIQNLALQEGYFIELAISRRDSAREYKILEHMVERNVDGIILFPTNQGPKFKKYIDSLTQPVVCIGNKINDECDNFVGSNDYIVEKEAADIIIKKDYDEFVFVAPYLAEGKQDNHYATIKRLEGFNDALENKTTYLLDSQDYLDKIVDIVKSGKKIAIFCASDIFALEIIKLLKEVNISINQQVGVIGYDNLDILKYVEPSITSIHYPIKELSKQAFEMFKKMFETREDQKEVIIPSQIIWRDSI